MKTHNGVKYRIMLDEFAIRRIKSGLRAFFVPMPVLKRIDGEKYYCKSLFGVLWCKREKEDYNDKT